eukprot:6184257-Pleurochrysis_carterae.AAC.2
MVSSTHTNAVHLNAALTRSMKPTGNSWYDRCSTSYVKARTRLCEHTNSCPRASARKYLELDKRQLVGKGASSESTHASRYALSKGTPLAPASSTKTSKVTTVEPAVICVVSTARPCGASTSVALSASSKVALNSACASEPRGTVRNLEARLALDEVREATGLTSVSEQVQPIIRGTREHVDVAVAVEVAHERTRVSAQRDACKGRAIALARLQNRGLRAAHVLVRQQPAVRRAHHQVQVAVAVPITQRRR